MTPEEFDNIKTGDTLYRFDETPRSYGVSHKTEFSIHLDRPCVLSAAITRPAAGHKIMKRTVEKYFYVTALGAILAEIVRIKDLVEYHEKENRRALEALRVITELEQTYEK